jgi:rubrerythrin
MSVKMRLSFLGMLIFAAAAIFFVVGHQFGLRSKSGMSKQTTEHLSTAMHGEAFAYAKYLLFAKQARQNGNEELATLFEDAANTERFEHFAEEAQLAGLASDDANNLKAAIQGEAYEVNTMYFRFAQEAATKGDGPAAKLFEEIRQDEMKHRDAFVAALDKLQTQRQGN